MEKRRAVGMAVRCLNNVVMRRFDSNRPDKEALEEITNANRWVIGLLVDQQESGKDVYQKALELSAKMRAYAEGVEHEITAGFTEEELDTLLSYIGRIKRNLGEK